MRDEDLNAMDLLDRINTSIKTELAPLTAKIEALDLKVGDLYKDRVTRSDLEKMTIVFVTRDVYETRHAQLLERDRDFEADIKEIRNDVAQKEAATQIRIDSVEKNITEKVKEQQTAQLSMQDRSWIRIAQVMGALGLIGAALEFIFGHVHLN